MQPLKYQDRIILLKPKCCLSQLQNICLSFCVNCMYLRARGSGFGKHLHMRTQERASESQGRGHTWLQNANEHVCSFSQKRCDMCVGVLMFVGRPAKEVLRLTVMHVDTVHHVMSTHYTVCLGQAVNRGCPGNSWWVECANDCISVSGKARRHKKRHYSEMIQLRGRVCGSIRDCTIFYMVGLVNLEISFEKF